MCLKSLATDVFLRTLIFTDMNFSEPFQTIALGLLSYLVVRIINHMIVFRSYFPSPSSFFHGFEKQLFLFFFKIMIKKQPDGVYILLRRRSQGLRRFLGDLFFLNSQNKLSVEQLQTTASELFSKLFSCSFFFV